MTRNESLVVAAAAAAATTVAATAAAAVAMSYTTTSPTSATTAATIPADPRIDKNNSKVIDITEEVTSVTLEALSDESLLPSISKIGGVTNASMLMNNNTQNTNLTTRARTKSNNKICA